MVPLKAADRNIEVMRRYLDSAAATGRSQVAAIGVAQEPQRVFIARQRDTDPSKPPQFSFDKKDRRVTVYYFYLWDAGFGPAFIKVCTYCPWPVKIWVNGHEWAKQQARKAGLGFTELSNGFASTEDPAAAAEDLRRAAARHDQRVLPALAGPAAAAAHRRRPARPGTGGSCRWPRSRSPAPSCSPSPATPAASSRRWSPTTSTWAARTPSRSSSTGRSARRQRATQGEFKTKVITRGTEVTVNAFYKHSRIKQYLKDGRALRIETVINAPSDLGCQRRLHNLDELQDQGACGQRPAVAG